MTQEPDKQRDEDSVVTQRARARSKLDQITQEVKSALDQQGIDLSVFLIVPTSGDAVVTLGTVTDPTDHEWGRVSEIVSSIVAQAVGMDRVRCREVTCAATTDHLSPREISRAETAVPMPIPVPLAAAHSESEIDATADRLIRLPPSHPILAELVIDPAQWHDFQRLADDNPAVRVLGYHDPDHERMTVYIACASQEVRTRLEDGWGLISAPVLP